MRKAFVSLAGAPTTAWVQTLNPDGAGTGGMANLHGHDPAAANRFKRPT